MFTKHDYDEIFQIIRLEFKIEGAWTSFINFPACLHVKSFEIIKLNGFRVGVIIHNDVNGVAVLTENALFNVCPYCRSPIIHSIISYDLNTIGSVSSAPPPYTQI